MFLEILGHHHLNCLTRNQTDKGFTISQKIHGYFQNTIRVPNGWSLTNRNWIRIMFKKMNPTRVYFPSPRCCVVLSLCNVWLTFVKKIMIMMIYIYIYTWIGVRLFALTVTTISTAIWSTPPNTKNHTHPTHNMRFCHENRAKFHAAWQTRAHKTLHISSGWRDGKMMQI